MRRIIFKDTSTNLTHTPLDIYSLAFELSAPDLGISYTADALPYIFANRQDREWYTLEADMIGLGEAQAIPDGVYRATFVFNNTTTVSHTFILFAESEYKLNTYLESVGFKVEVNNLNLMYQHANKYDFEQASVAYSLLAELKQTAIDGNLVAANEALKKLKRVLTILT